VLARRPAQDAAQHDLRADRLARAREEQQRAAAAALGAVEDVDRRRDRVLDDRPRPDDRRALADPRAARAAVGVLALLEALGVAGGEAIPVGRTAREADLHLAHGR